MIKHIVKKGETLWGLAERFLGHGSRWPELGYTGDPTKLPVGTVLNIPEKPLPSPEMKYTPTLPPTPPPLKPTVSPMMAEPLEKTAKIKAEIDRVTKQLTEAKEKVKVWLEEYPEAKPDIEIPSWVLEAASPEEVAKLIKPKRIAELEKIAFTPPPKSHKEAFEEEYKAAELDTLKKKIEEIDTKILDTTKKLYEGEARIQENPWLSEAGRVGRVKRLYEMAKKDIDLLLEERKMEAERYKAGLKQAQKTAEWALKDWEKQQAVRKKQLEYLTKTEKGEKIVSWKDLKEINVLLPDEMKLEYGATQAQAIERMRRAGVKPVKIEKKLKDWTEFTSQEKRKLKAWGIDWTTSKGYERALDVLYRKEEKKIAEIQYKAGLMADKVEGMTYEEAKNIYGPYVSKDWIDWIYGEKTPRTAKERAEAVFYEEMNKWLEKVKIRPDKYAIKSDGIYEIREFWPDKKVYSFRK